MSTRARRARERIDLSDYSAGEGEGDGDGEGEASFMVEVFLVEAFFVPDFFLAVVCAPSFLVAVSALLDVVVIVSVLLAQETRKAAPSRATIEERVDFFIGWLGVNLQI